METVKKCSDLTNSCGVPSKDGELLEFDEYSNNQDKYLNMIESGLNGVIDTYIQDGIVKYYYHGFSIDLFYLSVVKDGCFNWQVVEVGEYK